MNYSWLVEFILTLRHQQLLVAQAKDSLSHSYKAKASFSALFISLLKIKL